MNKTEDRHIDRPPDYVLIFRKACELIEKYGMDTGEMFTHNQVTALMIEFAEQYASEERKEALKDKESYAYKQAMAYENWLCEIEATKTISARPDYLDFFAQQQTKQKEGE